MLSKSVRVAFVVAAQEHTTVRNVRVCELRPRETSIPCVCVLILTARLALLEGDCRWWLELSEICANGRCCCPRNSTFCCFLALVRVCMCYLSGNVQITKIVSTFYTITADVAVVALCHTLYG